MGYPVVHWELWSKDPARISRFYERAFDWKVQHVPELDYRMVETGGSGGINGGIFKPQEGGEWPGAMAFYISVENLEAHGRRIEEAGGKIIKPRTDVAGMGAFALFEDPEGRVLGIWEAAPGEGTQT